MIMSSADSSARLLGELCSRLLAARLVPVTCCVSVIRATAN